MDHLSTVALHDKSTKQRAHSKARQTDSLGGGGGRVIEQGSRLYGYGMLVAGFNGIVVTGIAALPLTNWNGPGGIPSAVSEKKTKKKGT